MNLERFGSFVRSKRSDAGLSRRVYAKKLGISESFLVDVEIGKSAPARERFFDWAPLMGVNPQVLFDELEEPMPGGKAPARAIEIPYDFSAEDQRQVELFIKFLQFTRMLEYKGDQPDWGQFMKDVRESGTKEEAS